MTTPPYNATAAWRRAVIYFALCFAIGGLSGVWSAVASKPLITSENLNDPGWVAFTLLAFGVEIVAYFIIWPRGTRTFGRRRHLPAILLFGLLWGLSQGQLFLALFLLADGWLSSPVLTGAAAFVAIATFQGLWHGLYWDINVAPEHNIVEWNLRKVLFAHVPNLAISITYLILYDNPAMFIVLQTVSLLASTYFMRFPPPKL